MAKPDFYQLLHVHPDAPPAIIQASYRTLMQKLKHHPDLGGSHSHAARLNEAYATLSNPTARAAYDKLFFGDQPIFQSSAAHTQANPAISGKVTQPATPPQMQRCLFCDANNHAAQECSTCGSPLLPLAQVSVASNSQRQLERLEKLAPVTLHRYWPGSPVAAQSLDISPGGMRFICALTLQTNDIVKIDCSVCSAVARVAHVETDGHGYSHGVEFLTLKFKNPVGTFISTEV